MRWLDLTNNIIVGYFLYLLAAIFFFFNKLPIQAASTSSIATTVKISYCGNPFLVEDGEDCEQNDLQNETCQSLGFTGGDLDCDIACSFDVTSCTVPSIESDNVSASETSSLVAAGLLSIPNTASYISTPSLTVTTPITVKIGTGAATSNVELPEDIVITKSDGGNFDPTELTAAEISASTLSGFSTAVTVDGALQWGIDGSTLVFSDPITIDIYVGTTLNGQTLNLYRSPSASSGWTDDGIVSPATCIVSGGVCSFQSTKASYFVTTRTPVSVPSTSSSSSSSSSSSTSSSGSSGSNLTTASTPITLQIPIIPKFLRFYTDYLGNSGRIKVSNLYEVVETWVSDWKEAILAVNRGEKFDAQETKCDVDGDRECDLEDLSILLFYVE